LPLNPLVAELGSSAIRDLLALATRPGMLSLAGGLPAADTFPAARLAVAAGHLLRTRPEAGLQYGPTEGDDRLRTWIAGYEGTRSGRDVDAARVIVTAGSQQALDLVARTLVHPGAAVVVEEPGYLGALQALRAAGADLVPVPVDADGLDVDVLADRLADRLRPVAVHTVTTFHNPSGVTLSVERRRRLAELADRYGFVVIEDDPYAEIRFDGGPLPAVRTFTDRAVTLGSFSKTVAPGLRVGWCVLPGPLTAPVVRLKQAADLQAGALSQALVAELVSDGTWWSGHLASIREGYARRAAALSGALAEAFGERLVLAAPRGGMFLWGRFTDGTRPADLLGRALAEGVAFVPGAEFFTRPGGDDALRLSFATNPPEQLAEAVRRLAAAHAHPLP
jgi:2-aminoadipate transaminase